MEDVADVRVADDGPPAVDDDEGKVMVGEMLRNILKPTCKSHKHQSAMHFAEEQSEGNKKGIAISTDFGYYFCCFPKISTSMHRRPG